MRVRGRGSQGGGIGSLAIGLHAARHDLVASRHRLPSPASATSLSDSYFGRKSGHFRACEALTAGWPQLCHPSLEEIEMKPTERLTHRGAFRLIRICTPVLSLFVG